jgi:hypothetical protein
MLKRQIDTVQERPHADIDSGRSEVGVVLL